MKFPHTVLLVLILAVFIAAAASGQTGDVPLEKPVPTAPGPGPAPAPVPEPVPPAEQNPVGLLILAVILAHVCLPLSLLLCLVVLLLGVRLFRGGLTKLLMGIAATGGARGLKTFVAILGGIIVFPAGFLGLNWAAKWMDHRLSDATWWIYGLVVSVLTGFVFFGVMKAIARALKNRFVGMGGMMGNMGGRGMKRVNGKDRRR